MGFSAEVYLERIWLAMTGRTNTENGDLGGLKLSTYYTPVGAHSSGATITAATTLTKPTGATKIIIQAVTQNVRFTLDGTAPTATLGFQILAGGAPMIIEVQGVSIKVIQEAATASLQYQWVS